MPWRYLSMVLGILTLEAASLQAQALLNIDTVFVGNAGNAAASASNVTYDATTYSGALGYGAVGYDYRLGTTEVTIDQYKTFLDAVATVPAESYLTDLWNSNMQSDANSAGINRSGAGTLANPYVYSVVAGTGNHPIAYVDWFDAARFTNWLQNGATLSASTETGAYTLNGATSGMIARNASATWWLPSEDEWYKAAYYSPTLNGGAGGYTLYANQSNALAASNAVGTLNGANYNNGVYATTQNAIKQPTQNYLTDVGAYVSTSYYGTVDQNGNVWEWTDSAVSATQYRIRNGSWIDGNIAYLGASDSLSAPPTTELFDVGFRVATIPEPSTAGLIAIAGAAVAGLAWMRRKVAS